MLFVFLQSQRNRILILGIFLIQDVRMLLLLFSFSIFLIRLVKNLCLKSKFFAFFLVKSFKLGTLKVFIVFLWNLYLLFLNIDLDLTMYVGYPRWYVRISGRSTGILIFGDNISEIFKHGPSENFKLLIGF